MAQAAAYTRGTLRLYTQIGEIGHNRLPDQLGPGNTAGSSGRINSGRFVGRGFERKVCHRVALQIKKASGVYRGP